jgi:addiction module HigA family antidote
MKSLDDILYEWACSVTILFGGIPSNEHEIRSVNNMMFHGFKLLQMAQGVPMKKIAQCYHPGEHIKDEMDARGWNVDELAKRMSVRDVPVEIVQALIECKIDVNANIAFGLRRAFGTSARLWINLQKAFDLWKQNSVELPSIKKDKEA